MEKEMAFVICCIENYKVYRNLSGKEILKMFNNYGVLDYLENHYDVLHTTGYQYMNKDIDEFLEIRGLVPESKN